MNKIIADDKILNKLNLEINELIDIANSNGIMNPFKISKQLMLLINNNRFAIESRIAISISEIEEISGNLFGGGDYDFHFNFPDFNPERVSIAITHIAWFKRIANNPKQNSVTWRRHRDFEEFINQIHSFLKNINSIKIKREFTEDGAFLNLSTKEDIDRFQDEVMRIKKEQANITKALAAQGMEISIIKDLISEIWGEAKQLIEDINQGNHAEVAKKGKKLLTLLKKIGSPFVAVGVGITTFYIESKIK